MSSGPYGPFFKIVFVGWMSILWGHLYLLFRTSDNSALEFQSQDRLIITCTLFSLAYNVPQSHLWLLGPGIEPGSLAPKASMITLCQPDPAAWNTNGMEQCCLSNTSLKHNSTLRHNGCINYITFHSFRDVSFKHVFIMRIVC